MKAHSRTLLGMLKMQFDVKAVENIISSSPRKNGCFNLFFKLNDKIGIKLSNNVEQRDNNYHRQENAAKFGLGPDVYGMIDNVNYEGETYYGYFTEIVWVLEDFDNIPQDFGNLCIILLKKIELILLVIFNPKLVLSLRIIIMPILVLRMENLFV